MPEVYVDELRTYPSKGQWCHMAIAATDDAGDLETLHQFAQRIGLKRSWFQDHPLHPHYDLRPSKRELAIKRGAVVLKNYDFIQKCRGG